MAQTGTEHAAAFLNGTMQEGEKCTLLRRLFSNCSYCSSSIGTGSSYFGFVSDQGIRCEKCGWVYCSDHVTYRCREEEGSVNNDEEKKADVVPICQCCLDREIWQARPEEIRNKITLFQSAVIIGTGMGGLATALALKNRGVSSVTVLEKEGQLRTSGGAINIQTNAMRALLDIDPTVMAQVFDTAGPLNGFGAFKTIDGAVLLASNLSTRKESRWGNPEGRSIIRGHLTQILYDRCVEVGVTFHFAKKVMKIDEEKEMGGIVTVVTAVTTTTTSDEEDTQEFSAEFIVAADGIWSKVRQQVFPTAPAPQYVGYQMIVSVAATDKFDQMSLDCWGESWGKGHRIGHFRCGEGGTAIYYARNAAAVDLDADKTQTELKQIVIDSTKEHGYDDNLVKLVSAADESRVYLFPIKYKTPLKHHYSLNGRLVLMGDAANGMPPNLGQGGGMALESASILSQMLLSSSSLEEACQKYDTRRITRCSLIADQSKQNGDLFQASNFATVALRNNLFAYVGKQSRKQDSNDLELDDPFAYLFNYRLMSWAHS